MIESNYILDIFDLTFDDHKASELLRNQINFLNVSDTELTDVGLFINFTADKGIHDFKIEKELLLSLASNHGLSEMVNGVEIKNDSAKILADATVHIKNGFIDSLEIWNKNGEKYPEIEPKNYEMTQTWRKLPEKRIIKR